MLVPILIYAVLGILVVVVILYLGLALLARGKWLKCPDCGNIFRAPMVDQRRTGIGVNPPYLGRVKCPKCGQMRSRRDYQSVPRPTADSAK
jgi:predicted RNA-binding Zn-ribbon protein involved in translation (DUF1610 family)